MTTETLPTRELSGQVEHCEQPMKKKSQSIAWSGETETITTKLHCERCDARAVLTVDTFLDNRPWLRKKADD